MIKSIFYFFIFLFGGYMKDFNYNDAFIYKSLFKYRFKNKVNNKYRFKDDDFINYIYGNVSSKANKKLNFI